MRRTCDDHRRACLSPPLYQARCVTQRTDDAGRGPHEEDECREPRASRANNCDSGGHQREEGCLGRDREQRGCQEGSRDRIVFDASPTRRSLDISRDEIGELRDGQQDYEHEDVRRTGRFD